MFAQLFFEGEDNPAVSPATSPKTSPPQVSSPVRQDSDSGQCKLPSAIDRKVTGLKNALGFKVGVKRVRLYLKGWPPEGLKDRAAAAAGKLALCTVLTHTLESLAPICNIANCNKNQFSFTI